MTEAKGKVREKVNPAPRTILFQYSDVTPQRSSQLEGRVMTDDSDFDDFNDVMGDSNAGAYQKAELRQGSSSSTAE